MRIALARPDHRKLIESETAMPVRDGGHERRRKRNIARTGIEHDKVVAQPVHLHESQPWVASIGHGGAYKPARGMNPYDPLYRCHFRG